MTIAQKHSEKRADESADESVVRENGLDFGRLDGVLGFHVRMAQVAIYRDFADSMAGLGLTQKQCAVLELIAANPGVSQVGLAAALGTDRATMMALIDRLDDRALIDRRRSALDKRRQELRLTGAGTALLGQARRLIAAHEARFVSRFSADELDVVVRGLKRIYAGAD